MEKRLPLLTFILLAFSSASAFAHGGGLDAYGCHHNRKAGGYHCHRGELAGMSFLSQADMLEALSKKQKPQEAKKQPQTAEFEGVVLRVSDGDTLLVRVEGKEIKVRVYGIDAPEKKQAGGEAAKEFLEEMLLTQRVKLNVIDTDRYGRSVAIIRLPDGVTIQSKLLQAGHAWVYPQYCKREECKAWKDEEQAARSSRVGLWMDKNPTPPWEWRKKNK